MKPALLALMLMSLLLPGCVSYNRQEIELGSTTTSAKPATWPPEQQMVFTYCLHDGKAALETDRLILVFDRLSQRQKTAFHFHGGKQAVQIGGEGTSSVQVSVRVNATLVKFQSDYASGTNTLRFGEDVVRFTDNGQRLLVGTNSVQLTESSKVVRIGKNGALVE